MEFKEKIAYTVGFLFVMYGAFAGRDLSNMSEVLEGVMIIGLFLSVFLLFVYMNSRGIGDWHRKYN